MFLSRIRATLTHVLALSCTLTAVCGAASSATAGTITNGDLWTSRSAAWTALDMKVFDAVRSVGLGVPESNDAYKRFSEFNRWSGREDGYAYPRWLIATTSPAIPTAGSILASSIMSEDQVNGSAIVPENLTAWSAAPMPFFLGQLPEAASAADFGLRTAASNSSKGNGTSNNPAGVGTPPNPFPPGLEVAAFKHEGDWPPGNGTTPLAYPEPSSAALLCIGLIGLAGYGWRCCRKGDNR
jgi:hypothetical protein